MRALTTTSLFLLFLMIFLIPVQAADFGAELDNSAGIQNTGDTDWYTTHKITLWGTVPFDTKNRNSLAFEGSFFAEKPASSDDYTYYVNLDLFRFALTPYATQSAKINLDLGRIPFSDVTGYILNQSLDGVDFRGSWGFGNLSVSAAYTGLLNVRKTGAMMSGDDYADSITDDVYAFGAKRGVGKFTIHLPESLGPVDIIMEGLGQYDLRDQVDGDSEELVHTGYGTLMLTGPITGTVFFTVSGTFQTGVLEAEEDYSENAMLARARIDAFPMPLHHLYGEVLYTTAEGDFFTTFLPITVQTPGTLYGSGYSNIIKGSLGWGFNPRNFLNFDLSGSVFMYPDEMEGSDGLYSATELNAGLTYKATSDLNLRLNGALLFPKDEDMQYQAELKVVFGL